MSTKYNYEKDIGYGPFKFDMSNSDVREILGEPETYFKPITVFPEEYIDEEVTYYLGNISTEDYANAENNNQIPSFTYFKSNVVEISIRNTNEEFVFEGINLFSKQRKNVMKKMEELEKNVFKNAESCYFPRAGIILPDIDFWKDQANITFVKSSYIKERLEYDGWEEISV